MITSDKCYLNIEKKGGYKENERMGGDENYSASKASCEILFRSYFNSYLREIKKSKSLQQEQEMLLAEEIGPKIDWYPIL